MSVPVGVPAKNFAANFFNCAVHFDRRSSWRYLNFPFRNRDSIAVNGSRESRGPELKILVSIFMLFGRKKISATRTLAAQRLESIRAGAKSFISEKLEIFVFDEENDGKSILLSCLI